MLCRCCHRRIHNPKGETRNTQVCYRCRIKYPNFVKTIKGINRIDA